MSKILNARNFCSVCTIVHPGIDAVLTYFFKKSTVWRPFDLELPNIGQVITTHMASFLMGSFPWKRL